MFLRFAVLDFRYQFLPPHLAAFEVAAKDFSPSVGSHIYLWNRNISFFSNSVQRSWLYKPIDIADTCGFTSVTLAPGFEPTPLLTLQIRGWANLSLAREDSHPALH